MLERTNSNLPLQFYLAAGLTCARRIFQKLDAHWDGDVEGMNRLTMTDRETEGLDILTREAQGMGMQAYELLSGSRMFIYPGEDPSLPPEIISSHIDSVRRGGRYDGPAGIVAGMAAVAMVHDRFEKTGKRPQRSIIVLADRGEESVEYNQFGIASGMNAGKFDANILEARSTSNGKTWQENARAQGLDVDALRQKLEGREQLIPFDQVGTIWETHIEQGKRLPTAGKAIGVVSDFRGNVRYTGGIHFTGCADHTGATEMEDRLDAGKAQRIFCNSVETAAERLRDAGRDLVYTFHYHTDSDRTATAANAYCFVEARSKQPETFRLFKTIVEITADLVRSLGYGVNPNTDKIKETAPVSLNGEAQTVIRQAADELGIGHMDMASGAGHDLMNYAPHARAGFVLFGHGRNGLSHNPGEILGLTPEQDPFVDGNYPDVIGLMAHIVTRHDRALVPEPANRGDFVKALIERGAKPIRLAA